MVEENHGIKLDMDHIDMNDPEVYHMIGRGETAGIFQLESGGMTQFMTELKPTSIEDIIAGISLYRPGPMDQIPRYIRNKNHPESITYAHPILKPILNVTYGCMVYQEQVMQIVRDMAGYSWGRSDLVRRAMSKKKKEVMEEERQKFVYGQTDAHGNVIIPGAIRNGVDEKTANAIFDEMMDFASYAFNKSHAAAYAVVGYQTAWLKLYYPVEFMAAMLNSFLGSPGKISQYVLECKRNGIPVLPPDINESGEGFTVSGGKIRFGLAAVKNVGTNVVKQIIAERQKNGPFKSFPELIERLDGKDLNKRCVESLIKSGAFDSLKVYRSRLINAYEKIMDNVSQMRKMRMEGQMSFFDAADSTCVEVKWPELEEYDYRLLLAMEKDMLGLYLSGHPLSEFEEDIKNGVTHYSTSFMVDEKEDDTVESHVTDGAFARVAGIITDMKTITTRSNQLMAFVTLEDLAGQMEVIVFPNTLEKYGDFLKPELPLWMEGKISVREDEAPKLLVEMVKPLVKGDKMPAGRSSNEAAGYGNGGREGYRTRQMNESGPVRYISGSNPCGSASQVKEGVREEVSPETPMDSIVMDCLKVRIPEGTSDRIIAAITALLRYFEGNVPVYLYHKGGIQKGFRVAYNQTLRDELTELVGEMNVKYDKIRIRTQFSSG
jgi:DNA polymerase-3 subunit alpha